MTIPGEKGEKGKNCSHLRAPERSIFEGNQENHLFPQDRPAETFPLFPLFPHARSRAKSEIEELLAYVASLGRRTWTGTASDLLALLPADMRPASPAVLTKLLRRAEPDLIAAGVTVTGKRQPKTGARMITLSAAPVNWTETGRIIGSSAPEAAEQPENARFAAVAAGLEQGAEQRPSSGEAGTEMVQAGRNAGALLSPCIETVRKSAGVSVVEGRSTAQGDDTAPVEDDGRQRVGANADPDLAQNSGEMPSLAGAEPSQEGDDARLDNSPPDGFQPEFQARCARARASEDAGPGPCTKQARDAGPRRPQPSTRWQPDQSAPPAGICCRSCSGARWWSSDRAIWACVTCHPPPMIFPGQTPLARVTT